MEADLSTLKVEGKMFSKMLQWVATGLKFSESQQLSMGFVYPSSHNHCSLDNDPLVKETSLQVL